MSKMASGVRVQHMTLTSQGGMADSLSLQAGHVLNEADAVKQPEKEEVLEGRTDAADGAHNCVGQQPAQDGAHLENGSRHQHENQDVESRIGAARAHHLKHLKSLSPRR